MLLKKFYILSNAVSAFTGKTAIQILFGFRTKKVLDFLRLNESDQLKVLKLNYFNVPDLGNPLIQKLELANTILIPNIINTLNVVNTYSITTRSRANYNFSAIILTLPESNLLSARAEFKTTSRLISTFKLSIKNTISKVLTLIFTFKPLTIPKLTMVFLKLEPGLILLRTRFSNRPILAINLPPNKFYISTKNNVCRL